MACQRASAVTRSFPGLTVADTETGFLGRWARRKTEVLQGKPVVEPPVPVPAARMPVAATADSRSVPASLTPQESSKAAVAADAEPPALSLDDVKLLTKDSDFAPYMARSVDTSVRNAAMKKLFSDPHFNVMDGLDIYIDDYSIADPIPESMLRQMVSSKFLNLFSEEENTESPEVQGNPAASDSAAEAAVSMPGEIAAASAAPSTAASTASPDDATDSVVIALNNPYSQPELTLNSEASQQDHADSYLRLQPNHAASNPSAGFGSS